jgi:hypothetical protein
MRTVGLQASIYTNAHRVGKIERVDLYISVEILQALQKLRAAVRALPSDGKVTWFRNGCHDLD